MSRLNQTNAKKKKTVNDYQAEGPIDLIVHDLPHDTSTNEYWYTNCHLATIKGRHFSLFASFSKHSVSWALTDADNNKYYADSFVDSAATTEHKDKLHLIINDNSFQKIQEGKYQLKLHNPLNGVTCELNFMPFVNAVRHGNNSEDMLCYFIPACEANGTITIPGEGTHEVEGCGWYDHEFGIKHDIARNRITLQLDNSWQISGYDLFENNNNGSAILIDPDGNPTTINNFQLIPDGSWTSSRTLTNYPVKWRLVIAEHDIEIDIHATPPDQEFITIVSGPAFWKGRVQAKGKFGKKTVNGLGYIFAKRS